MNVTFINKDKVCYFENVAFGEYFAKEDMVFIRIDNVSLEKDRYLDDVIIYNAINLRNGDLSYLESTTKVIRYTQAEIALS